MKRLIALILLLTAGSAFCSCTRNPSEDELYAKLFAVFEGAGYAVVLEDAAMDTPVGIYDATVWKALKAGQETVLVYFDESNRADYLLTMIDQSVYGYATHFGQRFILNYNGADEALLELLKAL